MEMYFFTAKVNGNKHRFMVFGDNLNRAREEAGWKIARQLNISLRDISSLKADNEKTLSIFNFKMGIHKAKYMRSQWYYYIKPRRLTFINNPACYKWLFWWIAPRRSE